MRTVFLRLDDDGERGAISLNEEAQKRFASAWTGQRPAEKAPDAPELGRLEASFHIAGQSYWRRQTGPGAAEFDHALKLRERGARRIAGRSERLSDIALSYNKTRNLSLERMICPRR